LVVSSEPAWICQRSVDVDVPVLFAWRFMTDVGNWSDPPAEFTIDGPFAPGTHGTTKMPGQPAGNWTIRDVDPERAYTIETDSFFENASLIVHWRFETLASDRTRLTQRLELGGVNAARYVDNVRTAFEPNLEPGMQRIARVMIERASGRGSTS
jgi:polyketide cyclase/dehydrase/lipid transport protein